MTGNGKIARLPLGIRNQLNERLQNGEEGKELVGWLNGLVVVEEILEEKFGGRPISEQNLSEWKQRGYKDWCRRAEKRALLRDFLDEAAELEEEAGKIPEKPKDQTESNLIKPNQTESNQKSVGARTRSRNIPHPLRPA